MTTRKPSPATLAARALRAIPSEARSEQSRVNGRRGGRPPLTLVERSIRSRSRWAERTIGPAWEASYTGLCAGCGHTRRLHPVEQWGLCDRCDPAA